MSVGQYENEYNSEEDPKAVDAFDNYIYPDEETPVEVEPELSTWEDEDDKGVFGGKLMLDPSRWEYGDYAKFLMFTLRGDWEGAFPLIMKITNGWTFDIPFTPDGWRDISFADLPLVAETVDNTVKSYIEGFKLDTVKLNMRKWNMTDYLDYRAAARKGDIPELERLFRKVARLPGLKSSGPMTFEQGTMIAAALGKQVQKMFIKGE